MIGANIFIGNPSINAGVKVRPPAGFGYLRLAGNRLVLTGKAIIMENNNA